MTCDGGLGGDSIHNTTALCSWAVVCVAYCPSGTAARFIGRKEGGGGTMTLDSASAVVKCDIPLLSLFLADSRAVHWTGGSGGARGTMTLDSAAAVSMCDTFRLSTTQGLLFNCASCPSFLENSRAFLLDSAGTGKRGRLGCVIRSIFHNTKPLCSRAVLPIVLRQIPRNSLGLVETMTLSDSAPRRWWNVTYHFCLCLSGTLFIVRPSLSNDTGCVHGADL